MHGYTHGGCGGWGAWRVLSMIGRRWGWRHRGAGSSPEEMRQKAGYFAARVLAMVDATDEQRKAVGAHLDQLAPQAFDLRQEGRVLKGKVSGAIRGGDPTPEELEALRGEASALFERGSRWLVESFLKLRDTLTPEQRQRLRSRWRPTYV